MVFYRTGEYVDGAHFSAEQHSTSPVSSRVVKELLSARGIGRQLNVLLHTPNLGIETSLGNHIALGDPMLVALTPVTQSNMSSNVGGWMIWAKRIHLFFRNAIKQCWLMIPG